MQQFIYMESAIDRTKIEKMTNQAIASNNQSLKEIDKLQKLIEKTKHKKESIFKQLGITEQIQKENISVSDLSPTERTIFDTLQREFLAEAHAKGLHLPLEGTIKRKSKSLGLTRKGLKI